MSRQTLAAFRQTITVTWPKVDREAGRAFLVKVARENTARISQEQTGRAGIAPGIEMYANRPGNSNLESVELPGPIVSIFDYRREIAQAALNELRRASPRSSGRYQESHTLYLNGSPVANIPATLATGDELMISNPVPYSRKIEVGTTREGRAFVLNVEPRIYERVAKRILLPRYRNVANIEYGFVSLPSAYTVKRGSTRKIGKRHRPSRAGTQVRAPAITITYLR